jgi:hypothetical protein
LDLNGFFAQSGFRRENKNAHLILAKVQLEKAMGRSHLSHQQLIEFGLPRSSISHSLAELTALGVLVIQQHGAQSNSFGFSDKWKSIATL